MRVNFLVVSSTCLGQVARYSFDGSAGNEVSLPPDAQPINGTLSDITRGSGINPSSSAGEFSSNNWSTGVIDLDDYYTLTISANGGFELTLSSLVFDERRSGSGIRDISVRSSLDVFSQNLAAFNVPDNTSVRTQTVNFGGAFVNLSSSVAVEFRIYGNNAESSSGTWWVDNIQLFGVIATPDTEPPVLSTIEVLTSTSISVQFDEGVDQSTAENTLNYLLNGNVNPSNATREGTISQVTLTFANEFQDGFSNTLEVSNVEDLAGNSLTSASQNFVFNLISNATFKDIVINEIMADPTPLVGLPDAEYVELFNNSTKNIDLKNYTLNGDLITAVEFIFFPNEYIILTDDSNLGSFTGNVIEMPSMGALTNSGEQLILRDGDNALDIDIVTYDNSWYGDSDKDDGGYSLERIGPDTGCGVSFSWAASIDESGGTPATLNSVAGIEVQLQWLKS